MADRSHAGAARRRVGGRPRHPGRRLAGFAGGPPRATGRGDPSRRGPGRDPGCARCAAEVVLAHRRRARSAVPSCTFAAGRGRCGPRADVTQAWTSPNAPCAIDSSQLAAVRLRNFGQFSWKLTTQAWPVRSTAYQLKPCRRAGFRPWRRCRSTSSCRDRCRASPTGCP